MKLIKTFKDSIEIYNIKKSEDPVIFEEIQKAIANAFGLPSAEDAFDNLYSYVASIDQENNEVISGYRYIPCKKAHIGKNFTLNTFKYFNFSDQFSNDFADQTLELGRSFVNPNAKKKLWGLFSIWESGLGPLINYQAESNGIDYVLGQVSLREKIYNEECIKAILKMFWTNFGTEAFLSPRELAFSQQDLESFHSDSDLQFSGNFQEDKIKLTEFLRGKDMPKPTLFLGYADLVEGNKDGLFCSLPTYNSLLKCYEMGFLLRIDKISPKNVQKFLQASYNSLAFAEEVTG